MALSTLFQPVTAQTKNAPIAGGLPSVDASNAPAGSNPSQDTAAQISISPNSGALSSMAQGANQTSLTNMGINLAQGNNLTQANPGLFSGNVTGQGAINSLTALAAAIAGGMIPGFSAANTMSMGLGGLSGLASFFGYPGMTPTSELSGPIGEGLGMNSQFADPSAEGGYSGLSSSGGGFTGLGQGLANSINLGFSGPFGGRGINGQTGDPNNDSPTPTITPTINVEDSGPPSGPPGAPGAPGEGTGNTSDGGPGGPGGNSGDAWSKGGTIPGRGNRDTVKARLTPGEEVISAPEARRPGVRPLLKAINTPGSGPVEGGLRRLMGVK